MTETINPANAPALEKTKSLGIKNIEGKEIFIVGCNHNRGAPTKYTRADQVGEDGKTDYYTVKIETPIDLEYKEEGTIPINSFFVTQAIYDQLERIPNAIEGLKNGARLGPAKAIKRESQKTGNPYWCLAFESDADY